MLRAVPEAKLVNTQGTGLDLRRIRFRRVNRRVPVLLPASVEIVERLGGESGPELTETVDVGHTEAANHARLDIPAHRAVVQKCRHGEGPLRRAAVPMVKQLLDSSSARTDTD